MYKHWVRVLLLLLAIITLDTCTSFNGIKSIAFAIEKPEEATPLVGGLANHPSCKDAGALMAIVGGLIGTVLITYLVFAAGDPVSKVAALGIITGAVTTLTALVMANIQFFACTHAFVLHPVLRWESSGKYKTCKNPELLFPNDKNSGMVCKSKEYRDESGYQWPQNKAPYSEYIEVCYRYPLIPFPIPNVGGLTSREYDFGLDGTFPKGQKTKDDLIKMKEWVGLPGSPPCVTLKSGQIGVLHTVSFKAYEDGGRICVDAVGSFGADMWPSPPTVGCHARPPSPPGPMCAKSVPIKYDDKGQPLEYDHTKCFSCYISGACYSKVSLAARASFPMTSVVVQCIKESLSNLVQGKCSVASGAGVGVNQTSFLGLIQERLKSTVLAVLVLSVALFGIKMMLGHAIQGPPEYFMLLIKFALVIYFSIGNGVQVYYDYLIKLSVGLSDLVLSAGGNQQVCNYESKDYYKDFGAGLRDYSYLAPWDRLDCRVAFYLGNGFAVGGGTATAAALVAAATIPVFGVLLLIIPAIFAGQFLIAICVAYFIFMLLLVIIWIVHLFILSLIALTIVMIFAPLFVPMVLFQATKGFFDGWLKELMAFSIYPIILFAFLSLIFSVFDKLYFEDLKFTSHIEDKKIEPGIVRKVETFLPDYQQCVANPSILACVVSNTSFREGTLFLGIKVTKTADLGDTKAIWQGFGMMGLMAFLFYHFLGVIGSMAAELSGSFRADLSQHTSGPKQMASKIEGAAKKITGAVGSGIGNVARKAIGGRDKGGDQDGKERVSGAEGDDSKGGGDDSKGGGDDSKGGGDDSKGGGDSEGGSTSGP